MAEAQKRFPYRLLVCSALLAIVTAISLIEMAGRRAIFGRYNLVCKGMSDWEVWARLGSAQTSMQVGPSDEGVSVWRDGPAEIRIWWHGRPSLVSKKELRMNSSVVWWHIRRWARKAWIDEPPY